MEQFVGMLLGAIGIGVLLAEWVMHRQERRERDRYAAILAASRAKDLLREARRERPSLILYNSDGLPEPEARWIDGAAGKRVKVSHGRNVYPLHEADQ